MKASRERSEKSGIRGRARSAGTVTPRRGGGVGVGDSRGRPSTASSETVPPPQARPPRAGAARRTAGLVQHSAGSSPAGARGRRNGRRGASTISSGSSSRSRTTSSSIPASVAACAAERICASGVSPAAGGWRARRGGGWRWSCSGPGRYHGSGPGAHAGAAARRSLRPGPAVRHGRDGKRWREHRRDWTTGGEGREPRRAFGCRGLRTARPGSPGWCRAPGRFPGWSCRGRWPWRTGRLRVAVRDRRVLLDCLADAVGAPQHLRQALAGGSVARVGLEHAAVGVRGACRACPWRRARPPCPSVRAGPPWARVLPRGARSGAAAPAASSQAAASPAPRPRPGAPGRSSRCAAPRASPRPARSGGRPGPGPRRP